MRISELPLYSYSLARGYVYLVEYHLLNKVASSLLRTQSSVKMYDDETSKKLFQSLNQLFRDDAKRIREGVFPLSVLFPEPPLRHLSTAYQIAKDGFRFYHRRKRGELKKFSKKAKKHLSDLPRYYQINFHNQTDGYLSEQSAKIYDHQVEMLFNGTADPMRRALVPSLKQWVGEQEKTIHQLRVLEVAAGTGSTTRFVKAALPDLQITVSDLSFPYLKVAQERLKNYSRLDFQRLDASDLPYKDGAFDAVYSVYLHHEMPIALRKKSLKEMIRVVRPGGYIGIMDSIQFGDTPDFDPVIEAFPERYFEPFYLNYAQNPIEELCEDEPVSHIKTECHFMSKLVLLKKNAVN